MYSVSETNSRIYCVHRWLMLFGSPVHQISSTNLSFFFWSFSSSAHTVSRNPISFVLLHKTGLKLYKQFQIALRVSWAHSKYGQKCQSKNQPMFTWKLSREGCFTQSRSFSLSLANNRALFVNHWNDFSNYFEFCPFHYRWRGWRRWWIWWGGRRWKWKRWSKPSRHL